MPAIKNTTLPAEESRKITTPILDNKNKALQADEDRKILALILEDKNKALQAVKQLNQQPKTIDNNTA